jgi:hypothetical protein
MHACIHTCTCAFLLTCAGTCVCVCVCVYARAHTQTHACMHACIVIHCRLSFGPFRCERRVYTSSEYSFKSSCLHWFQPLLIEAFCVFMSLRNASVTAWIWIVGKASPSLVRHLAEGELIRCWPVGEKPSSFLPTPRVMHCCFNFA